MAEKILQTRIALKYDTLANWNASTAILKAGEIAIATIPVGDTSGASQSLPATLIKVGDGTHKFSELAWLQATSADVYSWAKANQKPSYTADEISGLSDYIAGEIEDTDTTYQIVKVDNYNYKLQSKAKNSSTWSDVSTIAIPNDEAAIEALETLVGTTAVATQIENAIAALDAAAVEVGTGEIISSISETDGVISVSKRSLVAADIPTIEQSQVNGLADSFAAKQDNLTFDGVYNATSNKAATVATVENAIAALDSTDTAVAGQVVSAVSETDGVITVSRRALVEADIPTLSQSKVDGLTDALAAKQDTVVWESGNYDAATNKAITKADLDAAVAGLSGATHFKGVVEELPTTAEAGDIYIVGTKEYIYDGSSFALLGDEAAYILKGTTFKNADIADDAAIAQSKIAGLTDALAAKANAADLGTMATESADDYILKTDAPGYNDILTKTAAATTYQTAAAATAAHEALETKIGTDIAAAIGALDVEDAAVENQVVLAVSETDGKIAVSRGALTADYIPTLTIAKTSGLQEALDTKANSADLAAIATTGNVNDLIQTSGDVLVFECGSASTNV